MCITSNWFYYNFLFLSKYLIIFKFLNRIALTTPLLFLKTKKWSNKYLVLKFFIFKSFYKTNYGKGKWIISSKVTRRGAVTLSRLSRYLNYTTFCSFFFISFFFNRNILFLSYRLLYYDFLNFMSYVYDNLFFFFFRFLNFYKKNKNHRKQFKKILKFLWKRYKFEILFMFDYRYSSFFFNVLKDIKPIFIGFSYFSTNANLYTYNIFLGEHNVLIKHLLFKQIFDIYLLAMFLKHKKCIFLFLKFQKLYIM